MCGVCFYSHQEFLRTKKKVYFEELIAYVCVCVNHILHVFPLKWDVWLWQ